MNVPHYPLSNLSSIHKPHHGNPTPVKHLCWIAAAASSVVQAEEPRREGAGGGAVQDVAQGPHCIGAAGGRALVLT